MSIVILLVLSSVIAAAAFLVGFLWATGTGQYDDIHTPAIRILFDDQAGEHRTLFQAKPISSLIEIHSTTNHGT